MPGTLVWASSSTSADLGAARPGRRRRPSPSNGRAAVAPAAAGHHLQALEQLRGLRAAVGLDEADDDVGAALVPAVALAEHRVGLAHAGRGAEVDPQPPRATRHWRCDASACHAPSVEQREVELEHVDAAARRGSRARGRVCVRRPARARPRRSRPRARGDPGDLERGVLRGDVRVESGAGGGDRVRRDVGSARRPRGRRPAARRSSTVASRSGFVGAEVGRRRGAARRSRHRRRRPRLEPLRRRVEGPGRSATSRPTSPSTARPASRRPGRRTRPARRRRPASG